VSAIQQNPALLRNSELRKKLNQIIYSRIRPGGVEYDYETRTIDPGFANRNYTGFDDQFSIFLPTQSTTIPEANKIQFKQSGGILSSGDNSTLTALPVLKTDQKVRGAGESKVF
jgi:hypothetical protein